MAVTMVMMLLCLAGIAFNVRFLVALHKECKAPRTFRWLLLHTGSNENAIPERREHKKTIARAA
jgi:hypothetical protein